ncbi:MAG: cysteine desulfurase, partial [Proteobacteria bacterium]|nr:cysteine desulfurase [Pseudomonadota bacterium]
SMCHAEEPVWEGVATPPLNVRLETPEDILREVSRIETQAVMSRAMPPGNVTEMTEEERHLIAAWLAAREG